MKTETISTRRFNKEFSTLKNRPLQVTDRGRVLGHWVPAPARPQPVDFARRAAADSGGEALPVSFARILAECKKR